MIELLLQAERALEMGRIDAAETLYRQVSEADPRNSIAVVGLARVTLERGDELGAYLTARRALAIDRENAAASRMVQRLEEVMRYRGDPVPEVSDEPGVGTEPSAAVAVDGAAEPSAAEPSAAVGAEPSAAAAANVPVEPAPTPVVAAAPPVVAAGPVAESPPVAAQPSPTRSASPHHDETLTPVVPKRRRRSTLGRIVARILGRR